MTIIVYGIAASRTSRPLWYLEELGLPYERVKTDYRKGEPRLPEFLAINPNGHIPAIKDGDTVVWESMACTLYLANRFAHQGESDSMGKQLAAQNSTEQADFLRWSFWVVTEVEKDALIVLTHCALMPVDKRDANYADQAKKRLMVPLRVLESHLGDKDYVTGGRFTTVDINLASVLAWTKPASELLAQFPRVAAWLERCLERPAQLRVRAMARADSQAK